MYNVLLRGLSVRIFLKAVDHLGCLCILGPFLGEGMESDNYCNGKVVD
jgi:hypothetical protein